MKKNWGNVAFLPTQGWESDYAPEFLTHQIPLTLKIGALPPCLFYGTVEPLNTKSVGHIVSLCYQDFVLSGAKTYKISARDMNITLLSGFLCFLTEFVFKGSQCRPLSATCTSITIHAIPTPPHTHTEPHSHITMEFHTIVSILSSLVAPVIKLLQTKLQYICITYQVLLLREMLVLRLGWIMCHSNRSAFSHPPTHPPYTWVPFFNKKILKHGSTFLTIKQTN